MSIARIVPPAALPVSLDEVKRHLRVETADDDLYITELIQSSVDHLETRCGIRLITQTWREYFDAVPEDGCFVLTSSPVQAVTEIRIFGPSGDMQSIPAANFELDRYSPSPRLQTRLPYTPLRAFNGIEIDVVAGYGDTALDVPDGLRRALLLHIAHNYEFRGAVTIDEQPASEPHGFRTLIEPYRRRRL